MLRLNLLGGFELRTDAGRPVAITRRKVMGLLAYLALQPDRPHGRDRLMALFWADSPPEQARGSLRHALVQLRKLLGAGSDTLHSDAASVTLASGCVETDVGLFRRALAAADGDDGDDGAWRRAEALYRGDLMEGVHVPAEGFEEWLGVERQRLREAMAALLRRRLDGALAAGDAEAGLGAAHRLLALDPLQEAVHRALMTLYARQGRFDAALRQYRQCRALLERELAVAPEAETQALFREIRERRGRAARPPPSPAPPPVPAAPAPAAPVIMPGAERRQVTVLVCDLAGAADLAAALDPEELHALRRACRDAIAGAVARFGGHAGPLMGNAVLACFGWPAAHEDAAERAVRAGLAVVRAVARLGEAEGRPLAARAGIATEPAVVDAGWPDGPSAGPAVTGPAPALAARLEALAPPGAVLVADGTRRLLEGLFAFTPFAPPASGAPPQAGPVWRVAAGPAGAMRFEARAGPRLTPLVGRDEELALLRRRWTLARAGEGQAVLLVGEAGIGKSRLARALLDAVRDEPHRCLRFQASPHHQDSALWPVAEHLAGTRDPEAAALLDAIHGGGGEGAATDETPQQRRDRTLLRLTRHLTGAAERGPALVLVEDAHWLDPTTVELLNRLAGRIAGVRLLLLVTGRPDRVPALAGHPHVTRLTLNRLGRDDARTIAGNLAGERALDRGLLDRIVARTDGVPLFVEELTKLFLETAPDGADAAIPASLHDSLMARFDRIGPAREVAQAAACIGRAFPRALLADVLALPAARIHGALERLTAAELVFRDDGEADAVYSFKHALVRDAAYGTLLTVPRRDLHGRIAAALERRKADPGLIAFHLLRAERPGQAMPHLLKAIGHALARAAGGEAMELIGHGLEAADAIGDAAARDAARGRLHLLRGQCLRALHGTAAPETAAAFRDARAACARAGDRDGGVAALYGAFLSDVIAARFDAAQEAADLLLADTGETARDAARIMALDAAGLVAFVRGRLRDARAHLEPTLAFPDRFTEDPQGTGRAVPLAYLAWALCILGHGGAGRALDARLLDHARRRCTVFARAATFANGCYIPHIDGDAAAVEARSAELLASIAGARLPIWEGIGRAFRGWALARRGEAAAGEAETRAALGILDGAGHRIEAPYLGSLLADVHAHAGRHAEAAHGLERCLAIAARHGERWCEADLHRRLAAQRLALDARDTAAAEAALGTALRLARAQDARLWELRAARDLARLWAGGGGRHRAADLLAPVCAGFTGDPEAPDLREARQLLDALR